MGLAATQTRFLSLTARKSNVEYKGQQINQQRTVLSDKSASLYSEMLTISVPVPPSTGDFTNIYYYYQPQGENRKYKLQDLNKEAGTASLVNLKDEEDTYAATDVTIDTKQGIYSARITVNGESVSVNLNVTEEVDQDAYDQAYTQYVYKQYLYENELEAINAKTAIIQQQDKALELELNRLDTEENELKTEMEALDKVLGDNVEDSYKTFGG